MDNLTTIALYLSNWLVTVILLTNYIILFKGRLKTRLTGMIVCFVLFGLENSLDVAYMFTHLSSDYQISGSLNVYAAGFLVGYQWYFVMSDVSLMTARFRKLWACIMSGLYAVLQLIMTYAIFIAQNDDILFDVIEIQTYLWWLLLIVEIKIYVTARIRKDKAAGNRARAIMFSTMFFIAVALFMFHVSGVEGGITIMDATVGIAFLTLDYNIDSIFTVRDEKAVLQANLDAAALIQSSMLPSEFPAFPERHDLDIFASMDPAKDVGGDFYDFFLVDPEHAAFVIADVSGKGIPASLFMVNARTQIRNFTMQGLTPAQVLKNTNKMLCEENGNKMFVTVWLGILNTCTGELRYANGGHNYPYLFHSAEGRWEMIRKKSGPFVGMLKKARYTDLSLVMEPGDRILLYTDGVTEAMDPSFEMFGDRRLLDWLETDASADTADGESIVRGIRAEVDRFAGAAEQFDDITMLTTLYRGMSDVPEETYACEARISELPSLLEHIRSVCMQAGGSPSVIRKVEVAADEIFTNISRYAYTDGSVSPDALLPGDEALPDRDTSGDSSETPSEGSRPVRITSQITDGILTMTFRDRGVPFDPLKADEPDLLKRKEEKTVGGLGIHLVKKTMDRVSYSYEDGCNTLTLERSLK